MSISEQADDEAMQSATSSRAEEMLLEFLREHDAACPVCGYNLKALTRPICPECGQELVLTVGATRIRMAWLFAAVAPGFFSGIAGIFGFIIIVGSFIMKDPAPWHIIATATFGLCSGALAVYIVLRRIRFLAQPGKRQMPWAIGIWFIHVAALVLLFLYAIRL